MRLIIWGNLPFKRSLTRVYRTWTKISARSWNCSHETGCKFI